MKLIDKDAIPWDVEGVGEIPVITKEEIDEMPTVDAIPVKWLEDRARIFKDCGADMVAQMLEYEIDWWRVKNREERR